MQRVAMFLVVVILVVVAVVVCTNADRFKKGQDCLTDPAACAQK